MTRHPILGGPLVGIGSEWRPMPGWPEYEVSGEGHIRRVMAARGALSGRILKSWTNCQTGYLQVDLWRCNRQHKATVHRLVALAFLGAPPTPDHVVAHLDGGRQNNHWTNLAWTTQRENMAHTVAHGTHNRGTRNGQAKLDEVCVTAIRKMAEMGIPRRIAAEGFGVCRQTVDAIANGKRWRHV